MKIIKNTLLLLTISVTLVLAEASIDTQIKSIKNASPSERVELMNRLKVRLSTMNSNERSSAIIQLRSQMQTGAGANSHSNVQDNEHTHIEDAQADNMRQMDGMERMHQKQAGDQYQHRQSELGNGLGANHNVNDGITYNKMFKY